MAFIMFAGLIPLVVAVLLVLMGGDVEGAAGFGMVVASVILLATVVFARWMGTI
jgi:hypothetical protein